MTEIVDWLQTPHGQSAIEMATTARSAGADALNVASRLEREFGLPSSYRAAASLQAELRIKLAARWGSAPAWLLTRDGIEQATQPQIRQWRARRLAELGIASIADLGCGLGFESGSFSEAGLSVRAVERDVETAAIAALNLRNVDARVDVFDVVEDPEALAAVINSVDAIFIDPARRDQAAARTIDGRTGNRVTDPSDWSPSWDWVCELGEAHQKLVAKIAPGIDHELLPAGSNTTWFAIRGGLAEASVWWPGFGLPAGRTAIAQDRFGEQASIDSSHDTKTDIANIQQFILDPSPAVTRSGLVTQLAAMTQSSRIDEHLGYLSTLEEPEDSPLFVTYEVVEVLPFNEKAIHKALVAIGARDIQISSRGYRGDIDALTKSLKRGLSGDKVISILLARVGESITAILAQRIN